VPEKSLVCSSYGKSNRREFTVRFNSDKIKKEAAASPITGNLAKTPSLTNLTN